MRVMTNPFLFVPRNQWSLLIVIASILSSSLILSSIFLKKHYLIFISINNRLKTINRSGSNRFNRPPPPPPSFKRKCVRVFCDRETGPSSATTTTPIVIDRYRSIVALSRSVRSCRGVAPRNHGGCGVSAYVTGFTWPWRSDDWSV